MSILVRVPLATQSADLITIYSAAAARVYLESSTTETGTFTQIGTGTVIVAGTEIYEIEAPAATDTTWFRSRAGDGTDYSSYSTVFQANAPAYVTLDGVKIQVVIPGGDAVDDAVLTQYIAATNAELFMLTGIHLGPSNDTVRTLDGRDAVRDQRRLRVVGGIRSISLLECKWSGGAFETVTAADYRLGPKAHMLRPGEPFNWIEFLTTTTGDWSQFPNEEDDTRATGAFGRASVAANVTKIGEMCVIRMYNDRDAGHMASPTPSKFIFPDDRAMLRAYRAEHFSGIG